MLKRNLFIPLTLMLVILLGACSPSPSVVGLQFPQRTLVVTGMGMVDLIPDVAYIYAGVHTEDASVADAVSANNAKAQAVMAAFRRFGVEGKDIQTTNFSIWPQQQYDKDGQLTGTTYAVDNTIYVTVRDLEKLGDLLEAGIEAGANSINGIQFDVADKSQSITQAREAAVTNARQQAEALAEATGVTLGDIQTISYYDNIPTPYTYTSSGKGGGGVMTVPVSSGQMQITTTVTILYELK